MRMENPPQISWAKEVKVTHAEIKSGYEGEKIYSVDLELPDIEANIHRNGSVDLKVDSRKNIGDHMDRSEELTNSLRRYLKRKDGFFIDGTLDWLGGSDESDVPPWEGNKPGVMDWWPGYDAQKGRVGKLAYHKTGRVADITDYWIGSSFPYVHFRLPDGDEGLAIDWGEHLERHSNLVRLGTPEGQEVWVGNVDLFLAANEEFFDSWESYAAYNEQFENGLLWALDLMGSLVLKKAPEWAVEIIGDNPGLLWPDLARKILEDPANYHEVIEKAARIWLDMERKAGEAETGQIYLWPRENDNG
jgi:hypothetical protein